MASDERRPPRGAVSIRSSAAALGVRAGSSREQQSKPKEIVMNRCLPL
jgi:hypothetical protein